MKLGFFLAYVIVEILALVALIHVVGWMWTILIGMGTFVAAVILVRRQGGRVRRELAEVAAGEGNPTRAALDAVLLALALILLLVPGFVTAVIGLLLLLSPVRTVARPVIAVAGARRVARLAEQSPFGAAFATAGSGGFPGSGFGPSGFGGTVVDGSIIDDGTGSGGRRGPGPGPGQRPPLPRG